MKDYLMLFMFSLIIPLVIIILGCILKYKTPKKNVWYGYKSYLSLKNMDTWNYSNKLCGLIWIVEGLIFAVISIIAFTIAIDSNLDTQKTLCITIMIIQAVILTLSIIPVEMKLKKNFDEEGRRI